MTSIIDALNNSTVNTGYKTGTIINADGSISKKNAADSTSTSLDQDSFMKILIAELKYQSPESPADTTAMMTQEAQFSQLSSQKQMTASLETLLNSQKSTQAAGMIGKAITANAETGNTAITGVVTGVKLGTDGPTLLIGDKEVALSSVTQVAGVAPTTTPTTAK